MIALFIIPGLLLLGAALVPLLARYRPRLPQETAVALLTLALLLWLALRSTLPLPAEGWALGGAWLLLLLTLTLLARLNPAEAPARDASLTLLLGGAALAAAWSLTPAQWVTTWLLLALVWGTAVSLWHPGISPAQAAAPTGWLLLAAFLLWYGAALAGSPNLATWLPLARTPLLLALLLQLGALPFAGWRALPGQTAGPTAVLLHLAPVVPGATLLAQLVATGPVPYALLATLVALLALLAGLVRFWSDPAAPEGALIRVGSATLLLAGMWAGPTAVVAEGRVLLLAFPLLLLLPPLAWRGPLPGNLPRLIGWAIALAALAGLPLTAGFNGRAALYDAWLSGGLGLLLPLLLLLHGVGLMAVVRHSRRFSAESAPPPAAWWAAAPGLLPVIGLLALPGVSLGAVHWLVWPALLLPLAAGLLLPRFRGAALDQPITLPPHLAPDRLRQGARLAVAALRDAALLLESERGLLWLFLLLLLLIVVS